MDDFNNDFFLTNVGEYHLIMKVFWSLDKTEEWNLIPSICSAFKLQKKLFSIILFNKDNPGYGMVCVGVMFWLIMDLDSLIESTLKFYDTHTKINRFNRSWHGKHYNYFNNHGIERKINYTFHYGIAERKFKNS